MQDEGAQFDHITLPASSRRQHNIDRNHENKTTLAVFTDSSPGNGFVAVGTPRDDGIRYRMFEESIFFTTSSLSSLSSIHVEDDSAIHLGRQ